jgi:hypothetical protein
MSPRIQGLLLAVLLLVLPWDALSYVTMKKEMTSAQSDAFKAMEPMLLDLGLAIIKDGEKIVRVVKPLDDIVDSVPGDAPGNQFIDTKDMLPGVRYFITNPMRNKDLSDPDAPPDVPPIRCPNDDLEYDNPWVYVGPCEASESSEDYDKCKGSYAPRPIEQIVVILVHDVENFFICTGQDLSIPPKVTSGMGFFIHRLGRDGSGAAKEIGGNIVFNLGLPDGVHKRTAALYRCEDYMGGADAHLPPSACVNFVSTDEDSVQYHESCDCSEGHCECPATAAAGRKFQVSKVKFHPQENRDPGHHLMVRTSKRVPKARQMVRQAAGGNAVTAVSGSTSSILLLEREIESPPDFCRDLVILAAVPKSFGDGSAGHPGTPMLEKLRMYLRNRIKEYMEACPRYCPRVTLVQYSDGGQIRAGPTTKWEGALADAVMNLKHADAWKFTDVIDPMAVGHEGGRIDTHLDDWLTFITDPQCTFDRPLTGGTCTDGLCCLFFPDRIEKVVYDADFAEIVNERNLVKEDINFEFVLPGHSRKQNGQAIDPVQLYWDWKNRGIQRIILTGWDALQNLGVDADQNDLLAELQFQTLLDAPHQAHVANVIPAADLPTHPLIELFVCNCTSMPGPWNLCRDCEDRDGFYITYVCPYESILMEYCYTCVMPPDAENPMGIHEYVVCDGWDASQIKDQCDSDHPLWDH